MKVVTGNTSKTNGGAAINRSFRDLLPSADSKPAQSSEEIISRLKSKLQAYGERG